MILRLKYVQQFRDRYGKLRVYFRRSGTRIALPAQSDPGFHEAYTAALKATVPVAPSRVPEGSLEALVRSYYGSAAFKQLGASTQAVYRRILAELLRRHGAKPVKLLDAQNVHRMIDAKADTPAAANHLLRTLRALMKHAKREKLITDDPTREVERLKEAGKGAPTWTEEDIGGFEARWPVGTKPRLALALLLYTGQRRSDVVRMGRQHVRNGVLEITQLKTGVEVAIPLHPELAAVLEGVEDRLTFLVTDEATPKPFTANGFYMRFAAWAREAGLPKGRSPHGLRKAAARRLAEAGCSAHQIAAITGHQTIAEVQRYTKAADTRRMAREAVARIGRPHKGNGS